MLPLNEYPNEEFSELEMIAKSVKSSFEQQFPNGWIVSRVVKGLGGPQVYVSLGIISDRSELISQIIDNDPAFHSFLVFDESNGKYEARNIRGDISINPVEKYLAMSTVKTKFRKTTGNVDKIIRTFDKFFVNLKQLVKDNEDNIYQRGKYSDKYFK